jgi:hypothetical protein
MIALRRRTGRGVVLGLGLVLACARPQTVSDEELPAAQLTLEEEVARSPASEPVPGRAPEALEESGAVSGSVPGGPSSSARPDGEVVHVVAGEVEPPRKLGSASLAGDFLWRFREYSFRGPCLVRSVVSRSGGVTDLELLRPEDCAAEVKAALLEQLGRARFEPARLDGEAVAVEYHLSIHHCPCYPPAGSHDPPQD